jgi:hypothetical protein
MVAVHPLTAIASDFKRLEQAGDMAEKDVVS